MTFESYPGRTLVQMKIHANELRAEIERQREVARAYEQWEADLISANEAWTGDEHVLIPTSLWERMLEIQAMRNRALGVLQPS